MVISNARLATCGSRGTLAHSFLRIADGKIAEIGPCPYEGEDSDIMDVRGALITPGFIDAHTHLGMWEEGLSFEGEDGNEDTDPCTPHLRALDGVNPRDEGFEEALSAGITTVVTGPGSANPIAGQICAMKTFGEVADEMVIKAPCAMKFALGENPKNTYNSKNEQPVTRMGIASIIREQLYKAKRYLSDCERAEEDEDTDPPDYDMKCEALIPVLKREIKAHFHCHRADDIATALRLIREFDLDGVIIHGTEGYLMTKTLKKAGVPVVCGPVICTRGKPELRNLTRKNPGLLIRAGIPVAVNTDAPEVPQDMLLTSVAIAARETEPRLTMEEALLTVTSAAADAAGISDRVGRLEPGKDADLLLFRENPVGLLVRPDAVMINGEWVK